PTRFQAGSRSRWTARTKPTVTKFTFTKCRPPSSDGRSVRRLYHPLLILLVYSATAAEPTKHRSAVEQLQHDHLEAVHEARVKWMRDRVVQPPLGVYTDYRAVLHVHAEDAEHTLGTREQVLAAAKETDVRVVM